VAGRSGALQRVTPVALVGYVRSPDQWSFSSMNAIDSISSAFQRGYLALIEREVAWMRANLEVRGVRYSTGFERVMRWRGI
jgi:hypothetical protein